MTPTIIQCVIPPEGTAPRRGPIGCADAMCFRRFRRYATGGTAETIFCLDDRVRVRRRRRTCTNDLPTDKSNYIQIGIVKNRLIARLVFSKSA